MNPQLLAILHRQNAQLPPSSQRDRALAQLQAPGARVVVTGQQMGLFGGPLFTLYKAISTVTAARQLTLETGAPHIPLFWLQTEDHDFAEIDHTFVRQSTQPPLKISLESSEFSRIPVAHRLLGDSAMAALDALQAGVANCAFRDETMALLRQHYRPEVTIAHAFAHTLAAIFADTPLVFFEARDAEVAVLATPFYRRLLIESEKISEILLERSAELVASASDVQVHIRPNSPLFFVSPAASDGPRYRLDATADSNHWSFIGDVTAAQVPTSQLVAWLEHEPLRFTNSALSRPLLQDFLLPTAVYIGGAAELKYFAQIEPLFAHLNLPNPRVLLRDRFTLIDDKHQQLLAEMHWTPQQIRGPQTELLADLTAQQTQTGLPHPEKILQHLELTKQLDALNQQIGHLDPSLHKAIVRTRDNIDEMLGKLVDKYAKTLAYRDQLTLEKLSRLRHFVLPHDVPQERVYGIAWALARFGPQALMAKLLAASRPFDGVHQDLSL